MTTANLQSFYQYARLTRRLAGVIILLLVAYAGLVNATIFNLSSRQSLASRLEEKQARIVTLESEYLRLSADVTMERALALGFRDAAAVTTFVHAAGQPVVALSESPSTDTIARP